MSALAAWDVVPLHAPARDRSRLRLVPPAGPEPRLATRPAPLRLTHAGRLVLGLVLGFRPGGGAAGVGGTDPLGVVRGAVAGVVDGRRGRPASAGQRPQHPCHSRRSAIGRSQPALTCPALTGPL